MNRGEVVIWLIATCFAFRLYTFSFFLLIFTVPRFRSDVSRFIDNVGPQFCVVYSGGWRWRHVHALNVARGEHSHFGFPWESAVVLFHVCITLHFSSDGSVRPQSTGSTGQMGSLSAGPHHLPLHTTDSVVSSVFTYWKHVGERRCTSTHS